MPTGEIGTEATHNMHCSNERPTTLRNREINNTICSPRRFSRVTSKPTHFGGEIEIELFVCAGKHIQLVVRSMIFVLFWFCFDADAQVNEWT